MNEQDRMNQIIKRCLSKQSFEHALLLNGSWGCGKTYFVNKLKEEMPNIRYFSLNGFDDISIVVGCLVALFFNGKSKNLDKIAPRVLSSFRKSNNDKLNMVSSLFNSVCDIYVDLCEKKSFEQKNGDYPILILDDLERISDKIDITDLLGMIHTKFVLNGVKVIYVADEQKIENKDKYDKEKEKYIFRTIDFRRNNKETYSSFLKGKKMPESFLDILLAVFSDGQDNLRTVLFCLDCYQELVEAYKKQNLSADYNSPEVLFYSICIIGKFYKAGSSDKEKLLSAASTYLIDSNENEKSNDPYKEFVSQVGSVNLYYCYLDRFIVEFVYDGFLDENALVEFLRKPTEDAVDRLSNVENLETSELKDILNKVKENLENENYTIRQYALLRQNFIPYADKLGICSKEEVIELLKKSIFSDKEENRDALELQYKYWQKDPYSQIKKEPNEIEAQMLKEFSEYERKQKIDKTEEFYDKLKGSDPSIFDSNSEQKDLFTRLVDNGYTDKLLSMANRSINMFNAYINSAVCNLTNANEWYSAEIPALERLEKSIDEKINSINNAHDEVDFMKARALSNLKNTITLAIRHIQEGR